VLIVKENQPVVTTADAETVGSVGVSYQAEDVQDTLPMLEQSGDSIHFGTHYFDGKIYKGKQGSSEAREVDRFYDEVRGTLTYKAKYSDGRYLCIPVEQANSTYDLYVGVIHVSPMNAPSLYLPSNSTSFFAEKASSFDTDGKINVLGKSVEEIRDATEILIVGTTNSLVAIETDFTLEQVIKQERTKRQQLASTVANLQGVNTKCPWTVYDSIQNLPPAGLNGEYEWYDNGIDMVTGHIDVDDDKGNRVFDLRGVGANKAAIVDVDLRGANPYETVIYFRGGDTIDLVPHSPLTSADFCFLNEEPDLEEEKEYVLSIQGNTIAYGTLTRGEAPVVEEED
jgi:hypothetical protein